MDEILTGPESFHVIWKMCSTLGRLRVDSSGGLNKDDYYKCCWKHTIAILGIKYF